ncbi:MAG: alkaline phosphatase family protein [Chloroflexota bacterium]
MKTIVIGLDGAHFELIDPWIEEGVLPNIARIKQQGVWADMRSVLPPVTSPNWKCYSTGKNPGKVGIFWWENIDWKNKRVYYPIARKHENKEIWDYLGDAGIKVGGIGMPTTYPPKKVNGFLVSSPPDASTKGVTYPRQLEEELVRQGWRNHPQHSIDIDREKASQEIQEIIDKQFKMAKVLGEKYKVDFLMAAVFHINTLHHFLWDAPETKKAWEIIDKHIGEFMAQGANIIIMSDHGSNKIETVFNINTWLKEEGYLRLRPSPAHALYRIGINQHSLGKLASRSGLLPLLRKIVPKTFIRNIPSEAGEIQREAKTDKVDWQKSKAFASGQGPIYLNPQNSDNDMIREEIKQKLEALLNPSTGERVIEKVYTKEELYQGRYLEEAPDLIIDQAKGVHIPGGIGQDKVFDSPHRWRAENKKFGLFMAHGPDIKQTGEIENVSILDLAPTILHLMNVPVPDDMDGKVLKDVFIFSSEPGKRKVAYGQSGDKHERERDKIRKTLRRVRSSER